MELIAVKVLTKSDLHKLVIPAKKINSFPQPPEGYHAKDFPVWDESGRVWPVGVSTRKKGHYKKPVMRGWRQVVLDKKLEKGDKVSFFKQEHQGTSEAVYMIKVEKPVSTDALVHGTAGKERVEEKSPISKLEFDAPVHGFAQVTEEGEVKIEEKIRGTMMTGAVVDGTRVNGPGEKTVFKLFGFTLFVDAPVDA